ncbi:MAG TPA: hypothetical protein VJ228_10850 [Candidatus Acidoferrales bacterium]|nr:hypothetical protein [Candidatus Acidoferrales bacterium]
MPNIVRHALWVVLLAGFAFLDVSSVAWKASARTWGDVVSGLQMRINLDQAKNVQVKTPKFRVELRNAEESDLTLNLGIMLDNGRKQYPTAIFLNLTDTQGKSRRLDLIEPADVAGRLDPFVLSLPVGATFSMPVDLDKYFAPSSEEYDYKPTPGTDSLEAQFTGKGVPRDMDLLLGHYWEGTVKSNRLRFDVPKK